ncbi:MAG: ABC transporter permease [Chloroflexi bacterium]|nr:ABC transporter permease [Chloroflexota bacterium]
MNILMHELRMYRRSTLTWVMALAATTVFFLAMFPAFHRETAVVTQLLGAFPQLFREAFGVSVDMMVSVVGYYTFLIGYIALVGAVQAMNLGTSLLSREISGKTADFLLTKPVTRSRVVLGKLLAGLVILAFTNLVFITVSCATAFIVSSESFDIKLYLLLSFIVLFMQLIFYAIGFVISTIARRIKSVLPLTLGTVFGFYIISLFSSAIKDDSLRYLTPFRFFDTAYIVNHAAYELPFVLLGLGIIVVAFGVGFVVYRRRDIPAA